MSGTLIKYVPAPVPVECLRLNEDIWALDQCRKLLDSVDPYNVAENPDDGYKMIRQARAIIGAGRRHAWDQMRREYLTKRIERKRSGSF